MNADQVQSRINWHQALVEVALIAIAVLIALAVDSWWDEHQERKAEIEYLLSLQADFEANKENLVESIDVEERILDMGKTLHSHIESGMGDVSPAELIELIADFYWLYEWEPITGTYDEMVGSGRLLYLRNKTLRSKLSQYVNSLEEIKTTERVENTNWFSEQSPFLRKHLIMANFGWIEGYRPAHHFDENLDALESREFHNLVSSWMVSHNDVANNYRRAIADGDQILEVITSELQKE